jgi:hypothetical protein
MVSQGFILSILKRFSSLSDNKTKKTFLGGREVRVFPSCSVVTIDLTLRKKYGQRSPCYQQELGCRGTSQNSLPRSIPRLWWPPYLALKEPKVSVF